MAEQREYLSQKQPDELEEAMEQPGVSSDRITNVRRMAATNKSVYRKIRRIYQKKAELQRQQDKHDPEYYQYEDYHGELVLGTK